MSNWIETQYFHLLEDILEQGVKKTDRTGTGTISLFGRQIRHNMKDGFPLLTTKKMAFKTMVTELLWFLRGDTNIKYLVDNDCNIWNGDAYKRFSQIRKSMLMLKPPASEDKLREYIEWYEQVTTQEEFINKIKTDDEFAKKWGELGPIYGKQWRSWERYGYRGVQSGALDCGMITMDEYKKEMYIDQIANSINLLKTDPDSRRNRVNAWNVGELDQMVLPPCHTDFQFFTRELSLKERYELVRVNGLCPKYSFEIEDGKPVPNKLSENEWYDKFNIPTRAISLMWNQRSVDTFLGLPFNIASYGLLLEIIAKEVNMVPDELIGNLGDVHLYSNHIEQAKEQLTRKRYKLPTLRHLKTDEFYKSLGDDLSLITHLDNTDFVIENYQSHPAIKAPLSN
jgi:thymidylate synthase